MNKLAIVLPGAAIALGTLFLYIGFQSGANGYVTLSIDGAFLLLIGLVSMFAPKTEAVDVETLSSLAKEVEGASRHIPEILEGERYVRFTGDAKIVVVDADGQTRLETIDPLGPKLRATVERSLASDHTRPNTYPLTAKYAKRLVELGALSDVKLNAGTLSVAIRLVKPVVGVPLLPEYGEPRRVDALMLSSRMLATLVSLTSADIGGQTVVRRVVRDQADVVIEMDIVGK